MYGPNWNKIIDNEIIENNEFRILILGGSTAQALPSKLIKKLINKINKKIYIFNLAFGGYVAQQELVALVTYINKKKFNLIINIDGANDIIHS